MNWIKLSEKEYREVWDRFYSDFHFKPSVNSWPSIKSDQSILKFNISKIYNENYPDSYFDKFHELGLKLLLEIFKPDKRLYSLDWQHECYDFDPRKGMTETGIFTLSLIPDGDYYIFLTKDFSNVWFGHPWEQTITLIGETIVSAGIGLIKEFENIQIVTYK